MVGVARISSIVVLCLAAGCVASKASAGVKANGCCWIANPPALVNVRIETHLMDDGQCTVMRKDTFLYMTPVGTCDLDEYDADCDICHHTHTNQRACGHTQEFCYIEVHDKCGLPEWHTGTANPCHKHCGTCGCQEPWPDHQ